VTPEPEQRQRPIVDRNTLLPLGAVLLLVGVVWHAAGILRDMHTTITNNGQVILKTVEDKYVSKDVFTLTMNQLKDQMSAQADAHQSQFDRLDVKMDKIVEQLAAGRAGQ
jgi:hypothetical protein